MGMRCKSRKRGTQVVVRSLLTHPLHATRELTNSCALATNMANLQIPTWVPKGVTLRRQVAVRHPVNKAPTDCSRHNRANSKRWESTGRQMTLRWNPETPHRLHLSVDCLVISGHVPDLEHDYETQYTSLTSGDTFCYTRAMSERCTKYKRAVLYDRIMGWTSRGRSIHQMADVTQNTNSNARYNLRTATLHIPSLKHEHA